MKRLGLTKLASVAAATLAFSVLGTAAAFALWHLPPSHTTATPRAASMPAGDRPHTTVSGTSIRVSWAGEATYGYRLARYGANGTRQSPRGDCAGMVHGFGCTETNVPSGTWTYTVQPVLGELWTGAESPKSRPPVTIPPSRPAIPHPHTEASESTTAQPEPTPEPGSSSSP